MVQSPIKFDEIIKNTSIEAIVLMDKNGKPLKIYTKHSNIRKSLLISTVLAIANPFRIFKDCKFNPINTIELTATTGKLVIKDIKGKYLAAILTGTGCKEELLKSILKAFDNLC